jgi:hypothetical protein
MLLGETPSGHTRYTTPAAGTAGYGQWSFSNRDADGDGIDNTNDVCPFADNTGIDADNDRLDSACDPTPGLTNFDPDGDGFFTLADNCPLHANGAPNALAEAERQQAYSVAAPDGGTRADGIGDPCDPNPTSAVNQGDFTDNLILIPKCIAGTDADADGYCVEQDPDDTDDAVGGFTTANTGFDQDGPNTSLGDGAGAFLEIYFGTDPLRHCGFTSGGDASSDTWPADLVESNAITIQDVLAIKPNFNQSVPPAPSRYDLVPSKSITIQDVLSLKPQFNTSCTPAP